MKVNIKKTLPGSRGYKLDVRRREPDTLYVIDDVIQNVQRHDNLINAHAVR